MPNSDVLVIGSGIAGLSLAIKLADHDPDTKITIITKGDASESNTKYAQGGMAVVTDLSQDSFQKHIDDTLTAGCGICDPEIVKMVVYEGPKRLNELIAWGAEFDSHQGRMSLGREGGHSENRIVHNKDVTGLEMELALLSQIEKTKNISLLANHFAVDLLKDGNGRCFGAKVLDRTNSRSFLFYSKQTVLSSGGIGQVYKATTNPSIATGDGLAMAIRAGASISDMEFIQFHPTALYNPTSQATFLISEAVRGEGAVLINNDRLRFMVNQHPKADLAPRDVVARAIHEQLVSQKTDHVYLDCTMIESLAFENHFPTILAKCLEVEIDPRKEPIPVTPAAHYACGGIDTDQNGRTSIENLYAIGECARTGLHGANRLASNSLLEALVFSHNAAIDILKKPKKKSEQKKGEADLTSIATGIIDTSELKIIRSSLQRLISQEAGIVRTTKGLRSAMTQLNRLEGEMNIKHESIESLELKNLIEVAKTIIQASLKRETNCGGFFNQDLSAA